MIKISTDKIKSWVYVTGAIRSGTTFTGSVLSFPLEVDYIHEPFNPVCGISGISKGHRYLRPSSVAGEIQNYQKLIESVFNYDFSLRNLSPRSDPWSRRLFKKIVGSRGPFYLRLAKLNPFHRAAVIKDPHGLLLTEYLYINFNVKPVILIKHPASFIASLRRLNWWPSLSEISDQPHLVEDYFSEENDFLRKDWSTPVQSSAAFWRAVYKVILKQANKYPDWQVITHEDLCQDPISVFNSLYKALGLRWSEAVERKILDLTSNNRSSDARKGVVQDLRRNSSDIFRMRRDSLSIEERKEIFEVVEDVALQVYSHESFGID